MSPTSTVASDASTGRRDLCHSSQAVGHSTSTLMRGEGSASHTGRFTPEEGVLGIHCIGGCVGHGAGSTAYRKVCKI
jgi:hypothetical protein